MASSWTFGHGARSERFCDVALPHESVSRQHCAILHDEDTTYVVDLGSAHGTYVDGVRLTADEHLPLRDGALLSSSDDLCAEAPGVSEKTGLGGVAPVRARGSEDAASEDDGTPKHERRRSGVPASVVWGKEGEETSTPMPPEA